MRNNSTALATAAFGIALDSMMALANRGLIGPDEVEGSFSRAMQGLERLGVPGFAEVVHASFAAIMQSIRTVAKKNWKG